jgi:FKBP-type peptidyl-prolyl cis-trans isomerase FkpA
MKLWVAVMLGMWASQAVAQGKGKAKPSAAQPAAPASAQLQTEEEKALYSLGYQFGKSLAVFGLSPAELEAVKRGVGEAATGAQSAVDLAQYSAKVQALARSRQTQANEQFLEKAAQEKGAQKLPSGIIYIEQQPGSGPSPKSTDTVAVHYRGTLMTGEVFDSSYKRNQVAEFPLNGVISCWTEGLQKMKVGAKAKLVCPAAKAYGERPPPGSKIPPNSVLQFEVELVGIPGNTSGK